MADNGRTQMLLRALACRPEGAATPELTEAIGEHLVRPLARALTICGNAMRVQERIGRAIRIGTTTGRRHQRTIIWQITKEGAEWLAYRALDELVKANSPDEAEARAQDLGVAVARILDFRLGRLRLALPEASASRTTGPPPKPALLVDQWTPKGLAAELGMNRGVVYEWIQRGWVTTTFDNMWIIHADAKELKRLRELRSRPAGYHTSVYHARAREAQPPSTGPGYAGDQGTNSPVRRS